MALRKLKKVAVVKLKRRLALLACIAASILASAWTQSEARAGALDMVLLVDKSLSMAPYFGEVKAYIASKVIEPILVPGDRLIIEMVYGRIDRLLSTQIGSEADKAKAIGALRAVRADGHYTDLGAALDAAKRDLDELGKPERPKYVLLVTDERQEAPKGSPYAAPDYKLRHPSLEYVKRVDMGKFRVITVGLQVAGKVEKNAPAVMELLKEAPQRDLAGSATGLDSSGQPAGGLAPAGGVPKAGASSPAEHALPAWLLLSAGGLLIAALAGLAVILLLSKRKNREKAVD